MSIHTLDSTITLTWTIAATDSPVSKSDFDITLVLPNGNASYTDDGIRTYVAPTATTQGIVTYNLHLAVVGHYQVILSIGTESVHVVNAIREVFCVDVPAHIWQGFPPGNGQGPEVLPPADPDPEPDFQGVTLARMNGDSWSDINAIGRGVNQGEIMFIGNSGAGNGNRDIGVLDTTTGDVTVYLNAVDTDDEPQSVNWSGVDTDRATGRMLLGEVQSISNFYPAFYSSVISGPWTKCSSPSTQFHGNTYIHFDDTFGVWFWQTGIDLFVSSNGISFVNQQQKGWFSNSIGDTGATYAYLEAARNPLDSNVAILPGTSEQIFRLERDGTSYGDSPFEPGCFSPAFCDPIEFNPVIHPYGTPDRTIFDHTQFSSMQGGVAVVDTPLNKSVYCMSQWGEIIRNDGNMAEDTWTVLSERDYGQTTDNPENELMFPTQGFMGLGSFQFINGKFYVFSSIGQRIWEYDGQNPAGLGWAPMPTTGFFTEGGVLTTDHAYLNKADELYAYKGRLTAGNYYVWFDDKDLVI